MDAWIVPAFCFGSPPHGALKTGRCSGLDASIVPMFCSGMSLHRALKTARCYKSDPNLLFVKIISVSCMRDFLLFLLSLGSNYSFIMKTIYIFNKTLLHF